MNILLMHYSILDTGCPACWWEKVSKAPQLPLSLLAFFVTRSFVRMIIIKVLVVMMMVILNIMMKLLLMIRMPLMVTKIEDAKIYAT